jgi:hypothetical protein
MLMAAGMAAIAVCSATADLFSPDRPLNILETEYFSIIFAAESGPAAEYLASFADDAYREIASLLRTVPGRRLPVVLTPDSELANGYYTWTPYPRIVLYQAPTDADSSLGSFRDDLRSLFYHELTHAVSLSIRSELEDAVVGIFGSPLGVSPYLAPLSFVEGVTVSFESLDGHGRAVDPLAGAVLRQDIVEGRWKTFAQASGAYDLYPDRSLYYLYGGYFSRYLQERYGMAAYAELWRRFGAGSAFRGLDDGLLGRGRFYRIYETGLSEAWDDFKESMTLRAPVYTATEPLRELSRVTALSARGSSLYYADRADGKVYAYDPASGQERALFRAGLEVSRIDASYDGSRLLLSTIRHESGFPRLVLKEWDAASERLYDLAASEVRDACYLPGPKAIVGIAVDGYQTDLVMLQGDETYTLLSGTESLAYSSPVAATDGRTLYAIAKESGKASIIRVVSEGQDGQVASVDRLRLPDGVTWVRYLSLDGSGVLRFSWDDDSFYRVAELDGDSLRYQTVPVTGGVHEPVEAAGRVYYLGRFSGGIAPCAFPEDRSRLGFVEAAVVWEAAPELLSAVSVYDARPRLIAGPYRAYRWLAPRFWLPIGSVSADGLETLGFVSFIEDPAERFSLMVGADWNFRAEAADVELEASWSRFSTPVNMGFEDTFKRSGSDYTTRISAATLGISGAAYPFSGGSLSWSAQTALRGSALTVAGASPYAPWQSAQAAVEVSARRTDRRSPLDDVEAATGYGAAAKARIDTPVYPALSSPTFGVELELDGYLSPWAIAASAYAAVAATDGIAYGPEGRRYASGATIAASYPVWAEFDGGAAGAWFAEGEASLRLLGTRIQRGAGIFYANGLSIRAGGRGYLASGPDIDNGASDTGWSVFGRASLTWTPARGALASFHPVSYLEFWYRPDLPDAEAPNHGVAFMLAVSY